MLDHLQFLNKTTWEEVFSVWKAHEGADPVWQKFAKEEKGWDTWEEWRSYQASFINASDREWMLYEIVDPNATIPKFRIGPFKGWQQHFEQKNAHTFEDLVRENTDWVRGNVGIKSRRENFPQGTQFIGLYLEDNDAVVLFEGHHRAAAVALATLDGEPISFQSNPTIALTSFSGDQSDFLDHLLSQNGKKPDDLPRK